MRVSSHLGSSAPKIIGAPRSAAPGLLARWSFRRRARTLYAWGRAVEVAFATESGQRRARRLYRRGLRVIAPALGGGLPARTGLRERDRLEWALALAAPWSRPSSWPRRHRLAAAFLAVPLLVGVVLALRLLGPRDIAAGCPWRASSAEAGFPIEGRLTAAGGAPAFMHTLEEDSPSVTVDLTGPRRMVGFEIVNRADCCAERAVPLAVELSGDGIHWLQVARRSAGFAAWRAAIPPRQVRFVRVRLDRRGILHLRAVRVLE